MTTRHLGIAGLIASAIFVVSFGHSRLSSANARVASHELRLRDATGMATRIYSLRHREAVVADAVVPIDTIISKVNKALSDAGLDPRLAEQISPVERSDKATTGPSASPSQHKGQALVIRRQTMRVVFSEMLPRELGQFLQTWRNNERLWEISNIKLRHNAQRARERAPGGYTVTLDLSSSYVTYDEYQR